MGSKYQSDFYLNKRYGNLVVLKCVKNPIKGYDFICKCDCENIVQKPTYDIVRGTISSCGCVRKAMDTKRKTNSKYIKNVGERFNRLLILEYIPSTGDGQFFKCKCDCGEVVTKRCIDIVGGLVQSCGCYLTDKNTESRLKYNNVSYIGKYFSYLKILKIRHTKGAVEWLCECLLCGTTKWYIAKDVLRGNTKSCGCLVSFNNMLIEDVLKSKNLTYVKEYTFDGLIGLNGGKLRYDFCVFLGNKKILIEYDGEQHHDENKMVKLSRNRLNAFTELQEHDKRKDEYAIKNNIKLIRLRGKITKKRVESILTNLRVL